MHQKGKDVSLINRKVGFRKNFGQFAAPSPGAKIGVEKD